MSTGWRLVPACIAGVCSCLVVVLKSLLLLLLLLLFKYTLLYYNPGESIHVAIAHAEQDRSVATRLRYRHCTLEDVLHAGTTCKEPVVSPGNVHRKQQSPLTCPR